nr:hypothetical protein [Haliscomenobacter sp.]
MKPKTSRIQPSRLAKRMRNDEGTIHSILDEALVCHVSYRLGGAAIHPANGLLSHRQYLVPSRLGRESFFYANGSGYSRLYRGHFA